MSGSPSLSPTLTRTRGHLVQVFDIAIAGSWRQKALIRLLAENRYDQAVVVARQQRQHARLHVLLVVIQHLGQGAGHVLRENGASAWLREHVTPWVASTLR